MKVFISWSGNRSRAVADILRDWTKCVIQASRPWISTRDIDRGALWFTEINDQLKDTSVGIICLTQENKNRPWVLFEAGALAKGLSSNRVCTLLIDLQPADLEDPLAQFNHTVPEKDSMWALIKTLNGCLGSSGLDERILEQVFQTYWEQFEQKFKKALKENPQNEKVEPRSEKTLLGEILENTRFLSNRIRRLETAQSPFSEDMRLNEVRGIGAHPGALRYRIRTLLARGMSPESILVRLIDQGYPPEIVKIEVERSVKIRESKPPEEPPPSPVVA